MPPGEIYGATEGGNGELGFYLVSDGSGRPLPGARPPAVLRHLLGLPEDDRRAHMIADAIATLGGLNIIAGELDR